MEKVSCKIDERKDKSNNIGNMRITQESLEEESFKEEVNT